MINELIIAPVAFPLIMALITLALWKYRNIQEIVSVVGAIIYFVLCFQLLNYVLNNGIQAVHMGSWDAPFGISFVADTFSALMILVTGLMALVVIVYSISSMRRPKQLCDMEQKQFQYAYYPLLYFMFVGISGAFLTGDIFNLYVWFEVMLIASFSLLSLGGKKLQMEGTFKYVTINLISSAFFLVGVGLLYGVAGTLNMAHLAQILPTIENQNIVTLIAVLFILCFGVKAAVFPLFFWLPASYHTPPVSVSAVFAGMLTKVGVYSLIRVFTLLFTGHLEFTHTILLWIGGFTMVVGVLGAAAQYDMRRILSIHIVSQIGYMIMGLALFTPLAIAGAIFYLLHNIIVKTNLFLISGMVHRIKGTYNIRNMGGLVNSYPFVAVLFLASGLALAGLPPLSGFWSKFFVVKAAIDIKHYFIAVVALMVGLLTLFSMIKIWNEAFWKKMPNEKCDSKKDVNFLSKGNIFMIIPVVGLLAITVLIGFFPETLFTIAERAAEELLDKSQYINAVLGGSL